MNTNLTLLPSSYVDRTFLQKPKLCKHIQFRNNEHKLKNYFVAIENSHYMCAIPVSSASQPLLWPHILCLNLIASKSSQTYSRCLQLFQMFSFPSSLSYSWSTTITKFQSFQNCRLLVNTISHCMYKEN